MRIKTFTKSAQITREPRSHDFTPGIAELEEGGAMWSGAPASQQRHSPQSNEWTNSTSSGLGKGLTEEQLFQQLRRSRPISREELVKLKEKAENHAIIAPIVLALISDQDIRQLVGNLNDDSSR